MNETLLRALTGSFYVTVVVVASLFPTSFVLVFGLFLAVAIWEFCRLIQIPHVLPIIWGCAFYSLFIWIPFSDSTILLITLFCVSILFRATRYLFNTSSYPLRKSDKILYLIGYIIFPFILLVKIPTVYKTYTASAAITLFVLIWVNDTFAYLVGKNLGKHKLLERISPNKTIEGFVGGLFFTILFAMGIGIYFSTSSMLQSLLFAVLVCIGSTLGDLIESKFKRQAGVKDSGNIMPGHGGVLDRLDSIIFVAPLAYLFLKLIPYVS